MESMIEGEIDLNDLKYLIGFQKSQFNLFQSTSQHFELEYEGEWEETNIQVKELVYQTYIYHKVLKLIQQKLK